MKGKEVEHDSKRQKVSAADDTGGGAGDDGTKSTATSNLDPKQDKVIVIPSDSQDFEYELSPVEDRMESLAMGTSSSNPGLQNATGNNGEESDSSTEPEVRFARKRRLRLENKRQSNDGVDLPRQEIEEAGAHKGAATDLAEDSVANDNAPPGAHACAIACV